MNPYPYPYPSCYDPLQDPSVHGSFDKLKSLFADEADYVEILREEQRTWRRRGWYFAVGLLEAFLTKSVYNPTDYDINLIKNSPAYRKEIAARRDLLVSQAPTNPRDRDHIDIPLNSFYIQYADIQSKFCIDEPELFYALGGSHFSYDGFLGFNGLHWVMCLSVVQTDYYTFAPVGALHSRMLFLEYKAAHELETKYNYKPFWHSEMWKETFTGSL